MSRGDLRFVGKLAFPRARRREIDYAASAAGRARGRASRALCATIDIVEIANSLN